MSSVWLENLDDLAPSNFRSPDGSFQLERHGYVGSIIEIDSKLSYNPYIKRALSRGKLKEYKDETEVHARMDELKVLETSSQGDMLSKYLSEDAGSNTSKYQVDDLQDDAEPGRAMSAAEILGNMSPRAANEPPVQAKAAPTTFDTPILDASSVLTPPEFE